MRYCDVLGLEGHLPCLPPCPKYVPVKKKMFLLGARNRQRSRKRYLLYENIQENKTLVNKTWVKYVGPTD